MVHLGVVFHDIMVLFRLHFVVLNQVCRSRQQAGQQISVISIHDFSTHNVENQAVKCLNPQLCRHKNSTLQTFQIKKVNHFLIWLFKIYTSPYSYFLKNNTLFCCEFLFLYMSHLLELRKKMSSHHHLFPQIYRSVLSTEQMSNFFVHNKYNVTTAAASATSFTDCHSSSTYQKNNLC